MKPCVILSTSIQLNTAKKEGFFKKNEWYLLELYQWRSTNLLIQMDQKSYTYSEQQGECVLYLSSVHLWNSSYRNSVHEWKLLSLCCIYNINSIITKMTYISKYVYRGFSHSLTFELHKESPLQNRMFSSIMAKLHNLANLWKTSLILDHFEYRFRMLGKMQKYHTAVHFFQIHQIIFISICSIVVEKNEAIRWKY